MGWRFYEGTYDSIKNRMGNMDVLIAMGTSAAWAYSAAVTFDAGSLLLLGGLLRHVGSDHHPDTGRRLLEHVTRSRASAAVRKLVDLQPAVAHRIEGGAEVDVPVEQVQAGDLLVVRPGERIPVDAVIVEGRSAVDESMINRARASPPRGTVGDEVIGARSTGQAS